jgi:hypothetical protein
MRMIGPRGAKVLSRHVAVLVASVALVAVGCSSGTPTIEPTRAVAPSQAPPTAAITPAPTAAPPADLAWTEITGLELDGAYIAKGAASASAELLLGTDEGTGALASWTSSDGSTWQRHWLDGATFGGGMPQAVVAGGPGFVAFGWIVSTDLDPSAVVWTSPDGVQWTLDPDPTGHLGGHVDQVAATPNSIVAWACCRSDGNGILSTSTDGIAWRPSVLPDAGDVGQVWLAAAGGTYLVVSGVSAGAGGTGMLAWRSTDGLTWTHDGGLERDLRSLTGVWSVLAAGRGFAIADDGGGLHLVNDDGSLPAIVPPFTYGSFAGGAAGLGWIGPPDEDACVTAAVRTASSWRTYAPGSGDCPTSGLPERRIAVPDGWLVVDRPAGSASDVVWALRPSGSVRSVDPPSVVDAPPASSIPELAVGGIVARTTCPNTPTIEALIALDGNDRVGCYGSRDVSFRAWIVDPGEGYGGTCPQISPSWLQVCVLPDWWLSAGKSAEGSLDGLKRPDATGDLAGVGRWVNVTGHFDDPAAATCRLAVGDGAAEDLPPAGWFVLQCRMRFVVTRMDTTN